MVLFFMEKFYDVLILGGGPAGLTAAIYAGRYNLKTLVVAASMGGTVNSAGEIENWPGFMGSGADLMKSVREQAEKFGAEFLESAVEKVEKEKDGFVLHLGDETVRGKSLIVALGTEHRQLNIPGEKEFLGKGVSYCATCDGNFFRDKTVAVIGGANSAAKAALYLSDICKKVYVVYRKHEMRCEPVNLDRVEEAKNVEIIYNTKPVEIVGEVKVTGLKLESSIGKKLKNDLIAVDGVFIEIGSTPITQIIEGLGVELDKGYIKVDKEGRTNVAGLFAAGDGTNNPFKQAITAAADGSLAAKAAYNFVRFGK